ncbi:MAG: helix-turn-helix domain-containing protein [Lachnospiraceae bacterium]
MDQSKLSHDRIATDFKPIHYESVEPERELKYHYHDFHEIFILLNGNVSLIIEGRKYNIQPGNIVLFHSHDLHRCIINESCRYERFFIYLNPFYLEEHSTTQTKLDLCFSALGKHRSRILTTSIEDVSSYIQKLEFSFQDSSYGTDIHFNNVFLDFLIFINLWLIKQNELPQINISNEHPLIGKVTDYINENLSDRLNIDTIAEHFFVSRSSLTREFRKFTGFSMHEYILTKRLLYAKTLLAENRKAIDIYEACGFISYPHFIKSFKNQFKMTPKEFQQQETSIIN